MAKKQIERHDLRHPVSGKFIPRPENMIKRLVAARQQQAQRTQAVPAAARLGGGAGILPLLMALRQQGGGGQSRRCVYGDHQGDYELGR